MSFRNYGNGLNHERWSAAQEQWQQFMVLLTKYTPLAYNDPEIRLTLLQIAQNLGIDPLTLESPSKIEQQSKIAVMCVDLCRDLWPKQGGNAALSQIQSRINTDLHTSEKISEADLIDTFTRLGKLGPGFRIETLASGAKVVCNASTEISREQGNIIAACDALGYVTVEMLSENFGWPAHECLRWLEIMLSAGLLWIDEQSEPASYWTPSCI